VCRPPAPGGSRGQEAAVGSNGHVAGARADGGIGWAARGACIRRQRPGGSQPPAGGGSSSPLAKAVVGRALLRARKEIRHPYSSRAPTRNAVPFTGLSRGGGGGCPPPPGTASRSSGQGQEGRLRARSALSGAGRGSGGDPPRHRGLMEAPGHAQELLCTRPAIARCSTAWSRLPRTRRCPRRRCAGRVASSGHRDRRAPAPTTPSAAARHNPSCSPPPPRRAPGARARTAAAPPPGATGRRARLRPPHPPRELPTPAGPRLDPAVGEGLLRVVRPPQPVEVAQPPPLVGPAGRERAQPGGVLPDVVDVADPQVDAKAALPGDHARQGLSGADELGVAAVLAAHRCGARGAYP